jgi:hypothetical protein
MHFKKKIKVRKIQWKSRGHELHEQRYVKREELPNEYSMQKS